MSPADFCYDTDASFSYAWLTCQLSTRYAAFLHHRGSDFTDFLYDSTSGISSRDRMSGSHTLHSHLQVMD